jgi:hypothetical protein
MMLLAVSLVRRVRFFYRVEYKPRRHKGAKEKQNILIILFCPRGLASSWLISFFLASPIIIFAASRGSRAIFIPIDRKRNHEDAMAQRKTDLV